jgi:arylsulfatase A-like enzyme
MTGGAPSLRARLGRASLRAGRLLLLTHPDSLVLFFALGLMHVALKVMLGVALVLYDGYDRSSLVAPPFSLVLALGDVGLCYALARAVDLVRSPRARRWTQLALAGVFVPFLGANFAVHSYCKCFINHGVIQFNGAGPRELLDYFLEAEGSLPAIYLAGCAALWLALALLGPALARRLERRPRLPAATAAVVAAGIVVMLAWPARASAGQLGWLIKTPAVDLVSSLIRGRLLDDGDGPAPPPAGWRPPAAPIFGEYRDQPAFERPALGPRPNVLLIIIESLPWEFTPGGGAKDSPLTVFEELAASGVEFESYYAAFPATSRSVISQLCGVHPNAGWATVTKYRPGFDCDSLPAALEGHGYRTGFFTPSIFTYDNMHRTGLMRTFDTYRDYSHLRAGARIKGLTAQAVEEEAVLKELLGFIAEDPARPFFATYFAFWTHGPYRLPFEDISALPVFERYLRTLDYINTVIGDLLARLEADGRLEDTIVVVTADHGEGFAQHHRGNVNHVIGHLYEQNVHIPLLIRVPGLRGPVRSPRLGSTVDLASTIFGLLGFEPPDSWQGQDLLSPSYRPRPVLIFSRAQRHGSGVIDGNLKWFRFEGTDEEHLFDVRADPDEQRDLIGERGEEAAAYRGIVRDWLGWADQRILELGRTTAR